MASLANVSVANIGVIRVLLVTRSLERCDARGCLAAELASAVEEFSAALDDLASLEENGRCEARTAQIGHCEDDAVVGEGPFDFAGKPPRSKLSS